MKYLGIDYGGKHIGLAIGDDESRFAVPVETLLNRGVNECVGDIKNFTTHEDIDCIVVGVPIMGNVFEGQKKVIEEFVEMLEHSNRFPWLRATKVFLPARRKSFFTKPAKRLLMTTPLPRC